MNGATVYEFDHLVSDVPGQPLPPIAGVHVIPERVFRWLDEQCLRRSADGDEPWLRMTQRAGRRAIQVTSFVGVIQSPTGFHIEVLPKIGKAATGGPNEARSLLIEMLCCLRDFRHVETESAKLIAARMPLLEVFIAEFLRTVETIVKQGIRGDYQVHRSNLHTLRGKMLVGEHIRRNVCRADRVFAEYDEFSKNRPENRLIHAALCRALSWAAASDNQQLARELRFAFSDVAVSETPDLDFKRARLGRGMTYYSDALAWARLILNVQSPTAGSGLNRAPSLLFPMNELFEAYVAKYLVRQLKRPMFLKSQARSFHLVRHLERDWFRLKPDLLICDKRDHLVLDTKWKLLDAKKANGTEKYGLSQPDFYQLQSYGLSYLEGQGDVVLVYPRTSEFDQPLPVFEFPKCKGLRLWVLPFCLRSKLLLMPAQAPFVQYFTAAGTRL